MELSELAAYAREKHTIQEQHKWADFPGFSVLAEPGTGKWAALLMRQWDGDTGEEVQRCDIKCGRQCLAEIRVPWLTLPFRMKGQNWVGVIFDGRTDPEIVFGLFDRAVGMIRQRRAYTVILEDLRGNTKGLYHDTALPQKEQDRGTALPPMRSRKIQETLRLPAPEQEHAPADSAPDSTEAWTRDFFREADGTGRYASTALPHIPQKIRDMMRLYEYQGESLEAKSRNFYRQGRFMEDYEDDASWTGEYRRYFTTYHDLHLPQLRGYFTWRTALRKGQFRPIASSLAYMYIYELLCGIGTSSPEDSLRKMREFEKGFLDSGIGDTFMRRNLHRWMLDYAVIHNVPVETARLYELPAVAERDLQLAVLKAPEDHSDEEIFASLCAFGGKKLPQSPVITANEEKGKHLFAALWRYLTDRYGAGERTTEKASSLPAEREDAAIFTACFGVRKKSPWKPLSNALHWEEDRPREAVYVLNACRTYRCHEGEWEEERYENPYFAKDRLQGLLHAADRSFRRYLKTGHYLRAKAEEAWAEPWIEAVIAADREAQEKAQIEAERKAALDRIRIDLSGLEKIRQDSLITRDSLLTEEERGEAGEHFYQTRPDTEAVPKHVPENPPQGEAQDTVPEIPPQGGAQQAVPERPLQEAAQEAVPESLVQGGVQEAVPESPPQSGARDVVPERPVQSGMQEDHPGKTIEGREEPAGGIGPEAGEPLTIGGLDLLHTQILRTLLEDQPVDDLIRTRHLMPAIVADTINEGLFDEIGDNVLECEEDHLILIEDYREDLADLFS